MPWSGRWACDSRELTPGTSTGEGHAGELPVGEQPQRGNVNWADYGEVAPVQRGELGLVKAFRERDDAGVHDADAEVSIRFLKLSRTAEVGGSRPVYPPCSRLDVVEESKPG